MNSELSQLKDLLSRDGGPGLIRIQASAGSGKTYALSLCYISLLGILPVSLPSLRSILAVTFTNKAAEEMKERVLSFLKKIALSQTGREEDLLIELSGLTPDKAKEWLEFILRNYGSFLIGTIDSFIFDILKGIALENGIRPDLTVESDTSWIIALAFDELLYRAQSEDDLLGVFEVCVKTFLNLQRKSGFFVEKNIKKMMMALQDEFRHELAKKPSNNIYYRSFEKAKKEFEEFCKNFKSKIEELSLELYRKDAITYLESPIENIDKAIFCKNSISEIFRKKSLPFLDEIIESLYINIKKARDEYLYQEATNKVSSYTKLFNHLNIEIERLRDNLGIIPLGGWLDIAAKYISDDSIARIYAILGNRLKYILIDEFQDTSTLQWNIMLPLIVNAISEGGRFIYVGDPKQSIYIWRGADPGLFLNVSRYMNQEEMVISLRSNFRSLPCIVKFNNSFYGHLVSSDLELLVQKLFGGTEDSDKIIEDCKEDLKRLMLQFYKDTEQIVCKSFKAEEYRCVIETHVLERDERDELLEKILNTIKLELDKGRKLHELAILIRKNEEAEEISELLWKNGYPSITKNSLRVERCPSINGLINLLRFINDPRDETALMRVMISGIFEGVEPMVVLKIRAENTQRRLLDSLRKVYPSVCLEIEELIFSKGTNTPYMISSGIIRRHRIIERYPGHRPFLFRYLDLLLSIEEIGVVGIEEMLERIEAQEERIGIGERLDAIKVLTIHDCKGLEFPVVLLAYCNWDVGRDDIIHLGDGILAYVKKPYPTEVKHRLYKKRVLSVLEAVNLLYVATTRAKEVLYMFVLPKKTGSIADLILSYIHSNGRYTLVRS